MNQQIRNTEYRIIFFLSNIDLCYTAILFCNYAVQCQRNGYPLIFLDSTIVMRIQISQLCIFVQRILLQIQTRRINMSSKNIHSFFDILASDDKQGNCLFHKHIVYTVTGLKPFAGTDDLLQVFEPFFFCLLHCGLDTFSFCLSIIQKMTVILIQFFQLCQFLFSVTGPYIFSFHFCSHLHYLFLYCYVGAAFQVIPHQ